MAFIEDRANVSTHNDTKNTNDAHGFAGLSSLLSNSDEFSSPIRTPEAEPAASTTPLGQGPIKHAPLSQGTASPPTLSPSQLSNSSGSGTVQGTPNNTSSYAWLWLIPVGIFLVIVFANAMKSGPTPATEQPQAYVDNAPAQTAIDAPPAGAPVNTDATFGTQPPVGSNLVLDESQIRYCVAQSIRLEGAQELAAMDTDERVALFNALVADYNSRCGKYRYHRGALEAATAAVEPYRHDLRLEGLRYITDFGREVPDDRPTINERAAADAASNDGAQPAGRKGLFDGVDTSQTKGFLEGATASTPKAPNADAESDDDRCEAANARDGEDAYNACVARNRSAAASKGGAAETAPRLTGVEKSSLESACSVDKNLHGPAAYRACVREQLEAFARAPRRPDLSRLSAVERQSMESACSVDKNLHGPAAYNTCLQDGLTVWASAPRRPDLAQMSAVERQSIESACSVDRNLHGPAAYNTCLQNQLTAWTSGPRRPNISRLSAVERESVESACSVDKNLHGPAAYNTCLSQQLLGL